MSAQHRRPLARGMTPTEVADRMDGMHLSEKTYAQSGEATWSQQSASMNVVHPFRSSHPVCIVLGNMCFSIPIPRFCSKLNPRRPSSRESAALALSQIHFALSAPSPDLRNQRWIRFCRSGAEFAALRVPRDPRAAGKAARCCHRRRRKS